MTAVTVITNTIAQVIVLTLFCLPVNQVLAEDGDTVACSGGVFLLEVARLLVESRA